MRAIAFFILALFFAQLSCALAAEPVTKRVPWTSSKVFGSPEPPPPFSAIRVHPKLTFKEPTELAFVPGSKLAIVVERGGMIYSFPTDHDAQSASLVANLREMTGPETDAYSITFHPNFISNRFVYVSYFCPTNKSMRAARFTLSNDQSAKIDLASQVPMVEWATKGHRGGALKFGPDGLLYVSTGDGGSPAPPDPNKTGQDVGDLLSSILRLDVDHAENGKNYRIPPDNPFLKTANARPEVWAYGMRNPWKMSFDYRDGALWVGDVGWETWEMIFRIDHGGFNGGWSAMEGPRGVNTSWPRGPTPIETPIFYYPHTEGASITGGFVYHGNRFPQLRDSYIYGDWETGAIWELRFEKGIITRRGEIAHTPTRIICFAEDNQHELFFMDYASGGVYQIAPTADIKITQNFPRKLSETGLFASTRDYQFSSGVVPYSIVAPSWNDLSTKDFAVAVPGASQITAGGTANLPFTFPSNSVLVRTFSMEMNRGEAASRRRLETQLLHFNGHDWNGYTYRWN
ncbi:MAG: PQQ-dependent sugar dehydrogenase, partial [Verrucomicrobiota bacterium]